MSKTHSWPTVLAMRGLWWDFPQYIAVGTDAAVCLAVLSKVAVFINSYSRTLDSAALCCSHTSLTELYLCLVIGFALLHSA